MGNDFIDSLISGLKEVKIKQEDITSISAEIIKRINGQGTVLFLAAGPVSKMIDSLVDSLEYLFKYPKGKIKSITSGKKYKELYEEDWKHFENNRTIGAIDVIELGIQKEDIVIALSSTGKTEYINNFLKESNALGASTIYITTANDEKELESYGKSINITLPKTINGLYTGNHTTILKVILDRILFHTFEELGQIHNGVILTTNIWTKKLMWTSYQALKYFDDSITEEEAEKLVKECDNELSIAIVMLKTKLSKKEAIDILKKNNYNFKKISIF